MREKVCSAETSDYITVYYDSRPWASLLRQYGFVTGFVQYRAIGTAESFTHRFYRDYAYANGHINMACRQ